jgi:hypothetical protein
MEEELDATNKDILIDNIRIIATIGVETYNVDNALLKLKSADNVSVSKTSKYLLFTS